MCFLRENGDWVRYRQLPDLVEVDFHWLGEKDGLHHENMDAVWVRALSALAEAYKQEKKFVLFTHGWSTSRIGKTTARSQLRKLMRSKFATPYISRKNCIQHDSVFVATIRPKMIIHYRNFNESKK